VGEIEQQIAKITEYALEEENTLRFMDLVKRS
jgi:hypothetical protein